MVGRVNCSEQNEQCGKPGGLGNRAHSYPVETVCPIPASPMPLGRTAHLGVIALVGRVLQLSKMRSLPLSGKSLSHTLSPEDPSQGIAGGAGSSSSPLCSSSTSP